jgi:predicted nucleic acid-binding Zn ribbon protein
MEKQKFCRYCGKNIPKKGDRMYYCSEECCRKWFYEVQEELFYMPGVKQEKCIVCEKKLSSRQLKYCSKACYGKDRFKRSEMIIGEMVKVVKRVTD